MKISSREKFFIIVLSISIIAFIGNKFVPIILINKGSVRENYNKTKEIYDNMSQNIKMKNLYEERKNKFLVEINSLSILSDIKQEDILKTLYQSLSSCGIEIVSISFSNVFATSIDNSSNELVSESKMDNTEYENNQLPMVSMFINIEFKSSYDKILALIDKLQENNYDIAITNIHIIKSRSDSSNNHCVMDLNFYAIPLNFSKGVDEG